MYRILIFISSYFFRFRIYVWCESTLFQTLVNLLLFLFHYFFYLVLHPNIVSLQKGTMTGYQISFILFNHRLKCTLYVNFMLGQFVSFHNLFLIFQTLTIQIFPYRFDHISLRISLFLFISIFMSWRRSICLLTVSSLWRRNNLMVGFKVLLLIKVHLENKFYILFLNQFLFIYL